MDILLHDDPATAAALARPLLDADPLAHTVALTVLDGMCRGGDPAALLATLHEDGAVVGALLRSPGRPALVSAVPPRHAAAVVARLARADPGLPGVAGPRAAAEAVAAAYAAAAGGQVRVAIVLRLFELGDLVAPADVPGAARTATGDDVELLARWRAEFAAELGEDPGPRPLLDQVAASIRLGNGELLWEVGGVPVAQAVARAPVAAMTRIGPVYTPPAHRRRGYAAAVTAAASRRALENGASRVVLFTDTADPAPNALYPRIGYRPVHDAVEFTFGVAGRR